MNIQTQHTLSGPPVCSVCIANYNGIGYIDKCINSIIEQDCEFPVEIIVHDDASTDNSVEFIRMSYPDTQLIVSDENVGFCISNNRMVEKARGRYILLLNNDAFLYPDALRVLYKQAEKIKEPAVLGLPQYDAGTSDLIDFGFILDPFLNSIPNTDSRRTDVAYIMGACLWLPKSLWNEVGGFPEWFHTMHEDVYMCCIARLYGYPVRAVLKSGYKHWIGGSLGGGKVVHNQLSTPARRRALSERNRIFVMVLCYPNPIFTVALPLHVLLLLSEGIVLAVTKKDIKALDLIYLSALRAFWKKRKELFSIRREIQKQNRITCKKFLSAISPIPQKLRMLIKHGIPDIT